jgi:hypothetical protein
MKKDNMNNEIINDICVGCIESQYHDFYNNRYDFKLSLDIKSLAENFDIKLTNKLIKNLLIKLLEKPEIKEAYKNKDDLIIIFNVEYMQENILKENLLYN